MNGANPSKLTPAAIGGVAFGVASAIPFLNCLNCACCALAIGGGFLAAALYFKELPPAPSPPYGDGAVLGLMTGAIGAAVATIVGLPIQLLSARLGFQPDMSQLEDALGDAEIPPFVQQIIESTMAGGLSLVAILVSFFFQLVLFGLFAMLGGIIGVAVFGKK